MPNCSCGRKFSDPAALGQHQKAKSHCHCKYCDCAFCNPAAFQQHKLAIHNWRCGDCNAVFSAQEKLAQHQRSTLHCYCKHCDRTFRTSDGLQQHKLEFHNWPCRQCNAVFSAQEKLAQHQKSTRHCYCRDCGRFFVHDNALQQHLRSPIHASQFHCCDCDRDFVDEHALEQHLANKVHSIRRRNSEFVCKECDREFSSARALEQHQTSVAHRPLSNVKCIAGSSGRRGCQRRFSCPSALLHHLESGACQSGITRKKLNAMVLTTDVDHVISNATSSVNSTLLEATIWQQLTASSSAETPSTTSDGGVIFTPSSITTSGGALSPQILTPQSYFSDAPTFLRLLSSSWTCPLCPTTHRQFSSAESLQQHLCSPVHSSRVFHCPRFLFPASNTLLSPSDVSAMRKSFSTLSGLAQHLESGACEGGKAALRRAVEYIEGRLTEMGMRKVKLLL